MVETLPLRNGCVPPREISLVEFLKALGIKVEEPRLERLVRWARALSRLGADASLVVRLAIGINLNVARKASESGRTFGGLTVGLPLAQEMELSPLRRVLSIFSRPNS